MRHTSRNGSTDKIEGARRGLGLRFWNFFDRLTIGPAPEAGIGRRTGGRI
jgi:hypothetical protein